MAHIVGVWELGGHLGHLARFATLASRLQQAGHRVSLVLRDLSRVGQFPVLSSVPVLQAPLWLPRARRAPSRPRSVAEILWHHGYLSAPGLRAMAGAWRALFDALRPDLVLYDYAPTALLASKGLPFRQATVGAGFCMPPSAFPIPPFQSVGEDRVQHLAVAEERVLDTVNQVLSVYGQPALVSLWQLFEADESFLCTVPELDHYPRAANTRYWGMLTESTCGAAPVWPGANQPRVFAYLKPSGPHFEAVLGAIINAGCQAAVFAPGVSREQVARYRSPAIQFSRLPFNIERAAGGADVAVCHAGHDTTLTCLLAGTPTLLIPLQMEQLITARRVEEQGAGVVLGQNTLSQCTEQVQRLVDESSFRDSAKGMAARYPAAKPPQSVEAVIARCGELVAID